MKLLFAFVLVLFSPACLIGQRSVSVQEKCKALYDKALTLSREGKSLKSSQLLNEILKLDSTFYMASFALADLSHEAGKGEEEIGYLQSGLAFSGDRYAPGFKFLAEARYKKGEYKEALDRMAHYSNLKKNLNPSEQLLLESCSFSVDAVAHPVSYEPMDPGDSINTGAEEYWPSLNAETSKLVFTRLETMDRNGQKIATPQEDFYFSSRDSNGWRKAKPIGPPVNTEENEGAQSLSADGKILIFTGCGRSDGFGSCDLYLSIYRKGGWTVPENLGEPVNSGAWESQPSLSADGETLFFCSNRKGGKGKMDIWKAEKLGVSLNGTPQFGKVTNVSDLNTPGNDSSPFLHADGKTLYFASDSRPGLGGTDLYMTRSSGENWEKPVNLGYPVNTAKNEEGLVVETSGKRAWFSSSRHAFHGRDIFYFALPEAIQPDSVSYLKGYVQDAETGQRLNAEIVLSNLQTNKVTKFISQAENDGDFLVCLPSGVNYGLNITREGYLFSSENISLVNGFTKKNPKEIIIQLQPVRKGALTILKNIFFETNSWQLKEQSANQLDEMARFMMQNPRVIMEIVGHTDRVGTETYNLELSRKRAEAVADELMKRKIGRYRLLAQGAGFSAPIGDNHTEAGRSVNRRTEFLVKEVQSE